MMRMAQNTGLRNFAFQFAEKVLVNEPVHTPQAGLRGFFPDERSLEMGFVIHHICAVAVAVPASQPKWHIFGAKVPMIVNLYRGEQGRILGGLLLCTRHHTIPFVCS